MSNASGGPEKDVSVSDLLRDASPATRGRWQTLALDYFPWRAAGRLANELGSETPDRRWRLFAHQLARNAADQGDPDAHAYLAEQALKFRRERLIERCRAEAEGGNPISKAILAGLLANSHPAEALEWDTSAGEHARAFWRDTKLREASIAVYVEAARTEFCSAAEKGYPFALERTGDWAIARGDTGEATSFYAKAATQGRPAAMYNLFDIYRSKNNRAALQWLIKSAEAGYSTAMVVLGIHLAPIDWPQAQSWLTQAHESGSRVAEKVLNDLRQARNISDS